MSSSQDDSIKKEEVKVVTATVVEPKKEEMTDEEREAKLKAAIMRFGHTDGLRGVGVMLVMFYHMGYQFMVNAWFCISMFFSLSGFLITAVTIESYERKGYVDILRFWSRRISRLFPAAILTIMAVTFSQNFRHDDGISFSVEKEDLVFAALFATNYNLVYRNKDDYFNEFLHPSITRHMWTLSIEEQYYFFWPMLIFAWTYMFGKKTNVYNKAEQKYEMKIDMTSCLWALCLGEILVISFSFFSSWETIEELGFSAGYYNTWCRMGDIACGGLAYICLRLSPLEARYLRLPHVKPMTKNFRIFLDLCNGVSICFMILWPMVSTPVPIMLARYFYWMRVPFSFLVSFFIAMGTLQYTETPLPKYCYFSRICSWGPLVFLGWCSYGVYLFHWPIIVIFGDPMGARKVMGEEEGEVFDWTYHGRNALIFCISILLGFISFWYYEKPIVMKCRGKNALSIIASGFAGVAVAMIYLYMQTKDLVVLEITNDSAEIFVDIVDDRTTYVLPGYRVAEPQHEMFFSILDTHTRPKGNVMIQGMDEHPYDTFRKQIHFHAGPDANVTAVMCKSWLTHSPCGDEWPKYLNWAWLESSILCGNYDTTNMTSEMEYAIRCDDKLNMTEIVVENENYTTTAIASEAMVLELAEEFPGSLNYYSVYRIEQHFEELLNGDVPENEFKMTFVGESVAAKIGMLTADFLEEVDEMLTEEEKEQMPVFEVANVGHVGQPSIAYYACENDNPDFDFSVACGRGDEKVGAQVTQTFSITKPDSVVIHDSHWFFDDKDIKGAMGYQVPLYTDFDKTFAFNRMAKDALYNGAQSIVFLTMSASDENIGTDNPPPAAAIIELNKLMKTIEVMSCSATDPDSIALVVFDWALLTCPTLRTTGKCPDAAHGFDNILPDGLHPLDKAGEWLVSNFLQAMLADVSKMLDGKLSGDFSTWASAKLNPYTQHLAAENPPDDNPPLEDLIHNYIICPVTNDYYLKDQMDKLEGKTYTSWKDFSYPL